MNFFFNRITSSRAWSRRALAVLALTACSLAGAVEVNSASRADLEQIGGIGPSLSERLIGERTKRPFTDWADLAERVRGVGPGNAKRLSQGGLTVNGKPYADAATAPARKASN